MRYLLQRRTCAAVRLCGLRHHGWSSRCPIERHPRMHSQGARVGPLPGDGGPANISGRQFTTGLGRVPKQKPIYSRDTLGRFHTRLRFALLFSRALFLGLRIDRFREFGQLFVSFCFFIDGLFQ